MSGPSRPAPPPPPVTSDDATGVLAGEPEVARADVAGAALGTAIAVTDGDAEITAEPDRSKRRRRRLRHRRFTRRRATLVMAVIAIAVAVALPVLGVVAARTIANSREGRAVVVDVPLKQLPSTPASLLVAVDDQGRPASLAVLSIAAEGQGGTVVLLPLATSAFLDGPAPPSRLDAAWDRGGLEAQTQAVESVLGVSTAVAEALDEDGLTRLFEPYAPVELELELPVLDTDAEGATHELFPAGPVELSARDMARLLLARGDGESELVRLPRAEGLWKAITASRPASADGSGTSAPAEGSAAGSAEASPAPTPPDVAGFLARLTAGTTGVHPLRVTPVFDPANPSAVEMFEADVAFLRLLVASVMPGAVSPSNGNISFRIVNPLGDPELTYRAVGRLAAVQANIVLVTETDDPPPATTSMVWHSPAGEVQAGAFAPVVGSQPPMPSDERIDGIDATLVLGLDFPAFLAREDARAAATSTTTEVPPPTDERDSDAGDTDTRDTDEGSDDTDDTGEENG